VRDHRPTLTVCLVFVPSGHWLLCIWCKNEFDRTDATQAGRAVFVKYDCGSMMSPDSRWMGCIGKASGRVHKGE